MIRAYLEIVFFLLVGTLLGCLLLWMVGMRPSATDIFKQLLWGGDLKKDWQQMRNMPKHKVLLGTLMSLIGVALAGFATYALRSFLPSAE